MRVITLNDDEALINYAKPIVAELRAKMIRVDSDFSATPFKAKISNAECLEGFPPPHVGGYGSSSAVAIPQCGTSVVSVRLHHGHLCPEGYGAWAEQNVMLHFSLSPLRFVDIIK